MKKVAFHTLGCKVNQYETQVMIEMFNKAGYEVTCFEQFADVYVINTCTVTSFGDKKSRQIIRRAKRINPEAIIAVVGCYAQISPDEVEKIEEVDVIAGTGERSRILQLIESADKTRKIRAVTDIMKQRKFEETGSITYSERTRAFIKIQEGCNNFCSYCIIPYARGPIRSRKLENIVNEVESLGNNGFKEIVLTGTHLTSYGKDLKNQRSISLIEIVEEISRIPSINRIRLGSIEPNFINEESIEKIIKIEKLCPHFHISLQSGSDHVLKRMNRKYTTREYREKVELLRKCIPDVSVTTDIIVGFPGENKEEFKETYEFLKALSLSKMHIFKYSPRKGTPAASYSEQVDSKTKDERSSILLELSKQRELEYYSRFVGRTMEVLFEQESEYKKGWIEGHTANFMRVAAKGDMSMLAKFGQVEIQKVEKSALIIGNLLK